MDFLYTLVVRGPSGSLKTAVSKEDEFVFFLCLHGEADEGRSVQALAWCGLQGLAVALVDLYEQRGS